MKYDNQSVYVVKKDDYLVLTFRTDEKVDQPQVTLRIGIKKSVQPLQIIPLHQLMTVEETGRRAIEFLITTVEFSIG